MKIKNLHLKILILTVISILFLSSCSSYNQDEVDLGDGYYYIPSQDDIFDQTTFDGNGIYTYRDSFIFPVIYPEINNYMYDSLYIIVKQKFDSAETNIMLSCMIFHPNLHFVYYDKDIVPLDEKYVRDAPNSDTLTFNSEKKYVDSIMHVDAHIKKMMQHEENYYIIDKKTHEVMGPFSKAEFNEERKSLQISGILIFKWGILWTSNGLIKIFNPGIVATLLGDLLKHIPEVADFEFILSFEQHRIIGT